jgi:hypothetical protein
MPLSWNEIKSRALAFSREWADAADEASEAKPFWIAFFEIFGITNKRVATFEHAVKKFGGGQGYVDLFWPGVLLVEKNPTARGWTAPSRRRWITSPASRNAICRAISWSATSRTSGCTTWNPAPPMKSR